MRSRPIRRRRRRRPVRTVRPLALLLALLAAVVTVPALAAPAAAAPGGGNPAGLHWTVQDDPFSVTFRQGTRVLTGQATGSAGPAARLSYQLADGTRHTVTRLTGTADVPGGRRYTVATTESGRTATVTVTATSRGARVEWRLSSTTNVAYVFEALSAGLDQHFLGTGMRALYVDLQRKVVPIKVGYVPMSKLATCNSSTVQVPFFLSSAGYGIYLDTENIGRFAFPGSSGSGNTCNSGTDDDPPPTVSVDDRIQIGFKAFQLQYEVYSGNSAQVMDAFTRAVGRPALPAPAQFGLIQSRDLVPDGDQLLDDAEQIQSRDIPLTAVRLDNPWELNPTQNLGIEGACIGSFEFDRTRFPDPKGLADDVHARGLKFVLWTSSFVYPQSSKPQCPDLGYPSGSLLPPSSFMQVPNSRDLDFSNPATVSHFQGKLRAALQVGADGIAADRGDESDWEDTTFAGGPGRTFHNQYPHLYAKAAVDELKRTRGNDVFSVFRAGSIGSGKGSHSVIGGLWASDQLSTWDHLALAIRMGLSASVSGFSTWGSDVGGYQSTDELTPELFLRWAQLGAISPIMQVHGGGRNARFWEWGEPTVSRFRDLTDLHYELFPYHYKLAQQANRDGTPILRPLGFQYPADAEAWKHDNQLMVGPDLLASIVTGPGATTWSTYLPQGQWVDLYDNRTLTGPGTDTSGTTIDGFPLYLRKGAAIPFNGRTPDVWATDWGTSDLARTDRAGWLYAPGTTQVSTGSPYGGTFTGKQTGSTVTLSLSGAPAQTQVKVLTATRPTQVKVDGQVVAEQSATALNGSRGWTYTTGRMQGVLLKLAPSGGASTVEITL